MGARRGLDGGQTGAKRGCPTRTRRGCPTGARRGPNRGGPDGVADGRIIYCKKKK
jgi:hypothetical protein